MKLLFGILKPKKMKFDISKVPEEKVVDELIAYMKKSAPTVYEILVAERDVHMAKALRQLAARYDNIVAVVGIGHKRGIEQQLESMKEKGEFSYRFVQEQQYF
jgi:pheromone shutdown protein TraB